MCVCVCVCVERGVLYLWLCHLCLGLCVCVCVCVCVERCPVFVTLSLVFRAVCVWRGVLYLWLCHLCLGLCVCVGGGSCGCYFVTCVEDGMCREFCICDFGWTAIGGGVGGCRVWSCTCYFDFCWEWCVWGGGGGGSCFCDSFGWRNVCVLYWWLTLRSVCVLPVLETWELCAYVSSTYTEGFVGARFL